ncbi:MAG: metalloregulator ArsR/SmtB family transcription factor [Myxococcaceae bacterium]
MTNHHPSRDRIFKALGDPTRLAVIERLSRGPASMTELARPFDMALPSFLQHVTLLEECGLVRSKKEGRVRTFTLHATPLRAAEHWLSKQRTEWEARLDRLDDYLLHLDKEKKR